MPQWGGGTKVFVWEKWTLNTSDNSKGDILVGLVTGPNQDTYPEDGQLVDNWYTLVTGDVDLTGINDGSSMIPSYYISNTAGVDMDNPNNTGKEWVEFSSSTPLYSDTPFKTITGITKHSASFDKSIDHGSGYFGYAFDVPKIVLKCKLSGVYVFTLFNFVTASRKGKIVYNRKVLLNNVEIANTTKLEAYNNESVVYQDSYWLKLKKGDLIEVKHCSGTAHYQASIGNYIDSTYEDNQAFVYAENTKIGNVNYGLYLYFWNYSVSGGENGSVVFTPADKQSVFEAVAG